MPERYASIVSTGICLPEREISNDLLRERFPNFPEEAADFVDKMEASTGIRRRWWAPDDWATSDLALRAAQQALENAGRRPEDVDLIILGTDSPDYLTPATSVVLQGKLGARNAGTFDVGCACAGYWGIFSGGTAEPATAESIEAGRTTVKLVQRYPPEINHEGWPRLVRRLAKEGGFELQDIDFLIFTQVRKPSIE